MTKFLTLEEMHEYGKELAEQVAKEMSSEPVAWGVDEGEGRCISLHDLFFVKEDADHMAELKGTHAKVVPLYTAPPQREWKGLEADGESQEIWLKVMEETKDKRHLPVLEFAVAIEAKLKEKNGG